MKTPINTLILYFPIEHINGILSVFDLLIQIDSMNEVTAAAAKLKKKILTHGRIFQMQDSDFVSLMFYESELRSLVQILSLYACVKQENVRDYSSEIGRDKKKPYKKTVVYQSGDATFCAERIV